MSKAKDSYYKMKIFVDKYMDGYSEDIHDYVTELENKAKMFDEMVINLEMAVDLFGDRDFRFEDLKAFLERAKKIQEAVK